MGQIQIEVDFPSLADDLVDADVTVYLEDVSEAGAPAVVLDRRTIPHVTVPRDRPRYRLAFDTPLADDAREVSVRVHVDATRSGVVTPGDFVSTTVWPLGRRPRDRPLEVPVERV